LASVVVKTFANDNVNFLFLKNQHSACKTCIHELICWCTVVWKLFSRGYLELWENLGGSQISIFDLLFILNQCWREVIKQKVIKLNCFQIFQQKKTSILFLLKQNFWIVVQKYNLLK
jgi:hypothetical protein